MGFHDLNDRWKARNLSPEVASTALKEALQQEIFRQTSFRVGWESSKNIYQLGFVVVVFCKAWVGFQPATWVGLHILYCACGFLDRFFGRLVKELIPCSFLF